MEKKKKIDDQQREMTRELTLQHITNTAAAFLESTEWQREIKPLFAPSGEAIPHTYIFFLAGAAETIKPHLAKELKKAAVQRGVEKITLADFFRDKDPNTGEEMRSIFSCIWEKYREPISQSEAAKLEEESAVYESIVAELAAERGNAPNYYVMPNNKLSNSLSMLVESGEARDLVVGKKGYGKNAEDITSYSLAEFTSSSLSFNGDYTPLDRTFGNAAISLWEQAPDSAFTAAHIWKAIPGNQDKDPTPDQLAKIEESIEKQRSLFVEVDATDELRARKIIDEKGRDENGNKVKAYFREPVLMLKECRMEVTNQNGKTVKRAYRFASKPILYHYAQLTRQYISAPAKRLDIKQLDSKGNLTDQQLSNTDDRMVLRDHVYRRIAVMKSDREKAKAAKRNYDARQKKDPSMKTKPLSYFCKQSDKIVFDTVFEETKTNTGKSAAAIRMKQKANRDYIFSCLDYWKADGFIKGYKVVKGGRGGKIEGVQIILE